MNEPLPQIINVDTNLQENYPYLDEKELSYIEEARKLFDASFYSYSLLGIWNAAVKRVKGTGSDDPPIYNN